MIEVPERLRKLLQRELGAADVKILDPDAPLPFGPETTTVTTVELTRGYRLVVTSTHVADRDATERRLHLVVESFRELLNEAIALGPRAPAEHQVATRLHEELRHLANAAAALDAVVIDAQSPVIWGAASAKESAPHEVRRLAEVVMIDPKARRERAAEKPKKKPPTERAIAAVRALPALHTLARGGHFTHHERSPGSHYVARSLASIYVLVLVFEGPFDDMRAERELSVRIELIERLVLALPPLDPTPLAGVRAIRSRRKK